MIRDRRQRSGLGHIHLGSFLLFELINTIVLISKNFGYMEKN